MSLLKVFTLVVPLVSGVSEGPDVSAETLLYADDECSGVASDEQPACAVNALQMRGTKVRDEYACASEYDGYHRHMVMDCAVNRKCCDRSLTCFEKDSSSSACMASCEPGIHYDEEPSYLWAPWSCKILSETASTDVAPVATIKPLGSASEASCPASCQSNTCEYWVINGGYSCDTLRKMGCDCDGCPSCQVQNPASNPAPTPSAEPVVPTGAPAPLPLPKFSNDGYVWQLHPIEVKGQHLYDSITGEQFRAKGIAFPDQPHNGDDVSEWIKTLQRIRKESAKLNAVRIYRPPDCAFANGCFTPFMEEADKLGFYVLVPGTGVTWGWSPIQPDVCIKGGDTKATADGCYKAGGVLGFGESVVRNFNFPNLLAIVIGNEIDQWQSMWPYTAAIKAYARDLKKYMRMCDSSTNSSTVGKMRQIPLMYAKSDDGGNKRDFPYADYMFCGGPDISPDIFGLNIERYCTDKQGPHEYAEVNKLALERKWPGAFIISEDGCSKYPYHGTRSWAQMHGEFSNYPTFDGFFGYTYFLIRQPEWSMFDGPSSTATITQDGKNFFKQVDNYGTEPQETPEAGIIPDCEKVALVHGMDTVDSCETYPTGAAGWDINCPLPYQGQR